MRQKLSEAETILIVFSFRSLFFAGFRVRHPSCQGKSGIRRVSLWIQRVSLWVFKPWPVVEQLYVIRSSSRLAEYTYPIPAKPFSFAGLARGTHPHAIKLLHGFGHQVCLRSQDTGLEVSMILSFHTESGPCQISGADIGQLQIKYQDLKMYPRT